MSHLFYVPLEPVSGRYTEQWSRANTGWLERNWKRAGVSYTRISGPFPEQETSLGVGKVLNPVRRAEWGFAQTKKIITSMISKEIDNHDVIFFDDFWHPGLEMIAQVRDTIYGTVNGPRLYSFCHAQSVDMYDFMNKSHQWARSIERGFMEIYDGVFVNNDTLKELLEAAFGYETPVINCGHVFSSEECRAHVGHLPDVHKINRVAFTSRFDREKQPHLFMDIVEETVARNCDIEFIICSGGGLRSDDTSAVVRAYQMKAEGKLDIFVNLTKVEYYRLLQSAKIQLSTSLQDWVSFCLLEAVTFGCIPLYPNYRSFPEAFGPLSCDLYPFHPHRNCDMVVDDVADRIVGLIEENFPIPNDYFDPIVEPHNHTWKRQLDVMGINHK